jgi:hypothetical protein
MMVHFLGDLQMETKKTKIVVLMLVALLAGIAQANMLVNPGFEDGAFAAKVMPDGWSMSYLSYTSGWTWFSDAGAHSGSKYLKLNAWVTGTDTDPYQYIPATEDLVYAFSVWAKAAPGKTADAAAIIYWYDTGDNQIGDTIHLTHTTVGDEWTYVEWTLLAAPAGTAEACFSLEGLFANGFWLEPGGAPNPDGGGIYYDDARMLGSSPDVDAGPDMITWNGQTVSLTGSTSLVGSITWSAIPAAGASITGGDTLTPDVTLTPEVSPFTYMLKLDIDGNYDVMMIDVYDDACEAAKAAGLGADNLGDVDGNCITDFKDFAVVVATLWLTDKTLTAPVPKP